MKKNDSKFLLIGDLISIKKLLTHRNTNDDSDDNLSGVEELSEHEGSPVAQRQQTESVMAAGIAPQGGVAETSAASLLDSEDARTEAVQDPVGHSVEAGPQIGTQPVDTHSFGRPQAPGVTEMSQSLAENVRAAKEGAEKYKENEKKLAKMRTVGEPDTIFVDRKERKWCNWCLYVIYKLFRCLNLTLFKYFLPYVAIFASYWMPMYFYGAQVADSEAEGGASVLANVSLQALELRD